MGLQSDDIYGEANYSLASAGSQVVYDVSGAGDSDGDDISL